MRYPRRLPEHLSGSSFVRPEGLLAGLTVKQLRGPSVKIPSRSIRLPAAEALNPAAAVRALSWVTPDSAVSHATAARLWGFPLPPWLQDDGGQHITRPRTAAAPRRRGVIGHQALLAAGEVEVFDGVRLTSRSKTWLDLAQLLSVDDLVVIGDHLVRRPRPELEQRTEPYATINGLSRLVRMHKGKRGVVKAGEALKLIRVGADSPPETLLRLALVYAGLPEPELNVPLTGPLGTPLHSPDQQYRQYRIAIEYEGDHHRSAEQLARDIRRAEVTAAAGWLEIRVTRGEMQDDARAAVAKIRRALYIRGWRPSSP